MVVGLGVLPAISALGAVPVVVGKTNPRGVAEGTSVDERLFQATALLALRPELSSCTSSSRSSAATSNSAYRQCRDVAVSRLRESERKRNCQRAGSIVLKKPPIDSSNDFAVLADNLESVRETGDTRSDKRPKSLSGVIVTVSVNGWMDPFVYGDGIKKVAEREDSRG